MGEKTDPYYPVGSRPRPTLMYLKNRDDKSVDPREELVVLVRTT